MKCKSCGGALIMRETFNYPLDENGVYVNTSCQGPGTYRSMGVYCLTCGARHAYEELHESGDRYTIALEANSDPDPVATVAIAFRGGVIDAIGADRLVGLLAIDEDRQEIGRFLARPDQDEWWERLKRLEALIKKGDHRASFAEKNGEVELASAEAIRRLHQEVD